MHIQYIEVHEAICVQEPEVMQPYLDQVQQRGAFQFLAQDRQQSHQLKTSVGQGIYCTYCSSLLYHERQCRRI